ncbi:copper-binding protein [Bradyrhizobium sp.]|uniref:copper-binding protein n=1 Tax=Bradyrhizobium sp. TaxID=376 RepID=UPI001DFF2DAE|nr:copper-binding protein [Bradyrhizobium sp.]MBI5319354.1 copper-binding protein [Bradyrhizobium sp.]
MKIIKPLLAVAVLASIGSAAPAQDAKTGMITQIDRINGTIAIQQPRNGTVGTTGGGSTVKQYKVQGVSLDSLHAGDQVSYTAAQSGGVDTVTKIEKKKR